MAKSNRVFTLTSWLTLAVLLFIGTVSARADGKVFAPVLVPQQVEMPDQRALLAWKDGVETLVIESAFVGKGTDFAWVVPLPGKPEVFPATSGTLPSAVALMQPTIAKPMTAAWPLAIIVGGIGLVALAFGWRVVVLGIRAAIILGFVAIPAIALGAIAQSAIVAALVFAAGTFSLWPLRHWIYKGTTLANAITCLLILAFLAYILFPSIGGTMNSPLSAAGGITVERKNVGDYDVAVISGRDGDGVIAWLKDHGYALSEPARKVAAEHASADGWFVASRVRREFAESGRSVPAPLAFRFPSNQAVYPMRLTGAGANYPLEVELVVFGPGRAEVTGLKNRTAAPLTQGEPVAQKGWWGELQSRDGRKITHPELTRWTQGTGVATWMRGTLSPAQMQADLPVHWTANREALGLYAVATADAWAQAALLGALLCFTGAMILGLTVRNGPPTRKWTGAVMLISLVSGITLRGLTPTVSVEPSSNGWRSLDLRYMGHLVANAVGELPANASDDLVQAAFVKALADFKPEHGAPIQLGDAPGEAMLHKLPDGSWRVWFFDSYGQPQFFPGDDIKLTGNQGPK